MNICQLVYGDPSPSLDKEGIHVWLLPLAHLPVDLRALFPDEQARAERFRFEHDRHRWVATRSMVRSLLGGYTAQAPSAVRFACTGYGKIFLPDHPTICFNLSHSRDYGLLAVARGRQVGVDIEYVRPDFADRAVASHFFSDNEQAALDAFTPDNYPTAFFTCWVRKESYIKARGEGLSHPLKDFDVSIQPDATDLLLATRPDAQERGCWHMQTIAVPKGYLSALTVRDGSSTKPCLTGYEYFRD